MGSSAETLRFDTRKLEPVFMPDGDRVDVRIITQTEANQKYKFVKPGSTALHEAEHAVVAEESGTPVVMVTIYQSSMNL